MNQNIEFKANQLLDAADCHELPIDVGELARRNCYNIKNYSACKALIRKLSAEDIIQRFSSISFKFDGAYYILLSDDLTRDEEQKLIAHEIGHIQLHGLRSFDISHLHEERPYTEIQEIEADTFALCLLAPLALLGERKIKDPSGIKELTGLSLSDCCTVFKSLQGYYNERCVANSRHRLLENYKSGKIRLLKYYFAVFSLCLVVLIFNLFANLNTSATEVTNDNTLEDISCSSSAFNKAVGNSSKDSEQIISSCPPQEVGDSVSGVSPKSINATYYWTDSGSVYHSFEDCQSLKNSAEIKSGTLSTAKAAKSRLCKFCENKLH